MNLIVVALVVAAIQEENTRQVNWKQDDFFISFWVGPQVPLQELDERFAELVEANFTGFLGFNGGGSIAAPNPARVAAEITACDKYNLRCVPSICESISRKPTPGGSCAGLGVNATNMWCVCVCVCVWVCE